MSDHREDLLVVFENDAAALDAFRRGELPARHAERVREATRSDAVWMTGLAIVLAAVMWSILGYLIHDGRMFRDASGASDVFGLGAIVLVAGVLPAAAVGWAVWTWVIHSRTTPRVSVLEGRISLAEHRHRGMVVLREVRVLERAFAVNERAFAVLREGDRYRVFFVPVGDVVVGMEPL